MPPGTIYAGEDYPTDYNRNKLTVPCGGSGLMVTPDSTLRTVAVRGGRVTVGAHNAYSRLILRDPLTVPFAFSGEILLHHRLDEVTIYGENRVPTWEWGVCMHPVFVDEDNNLVDCCKPAYTKWGSSGQIDHTYGIPFDLKYNAPIQHADIMDGAWHEFRMEVPEIGRHLLYWDDVRMVELNEPNPPAAWWSRPLRAGMRLDFYDFELRNLNAA